MISAIVIVLAAYFTALFFVKNVMPQLKMWLKILPATRVKPFDCTQCLSVWLAVVFYFLPYEYSNFFAIVFGAGLLGTKLSK